MDLRACIALSVLETLASTLATQLMSWAALQTFWGLFLAQYAAVKIYRIWIYPAYLSPLRYLPGPKAKNIRAPVHD
jgi:hypothetical protein